MQAFDESCAEIRGETVRLVLPIEIQGVTNEYTLMFTAEQPEIVTWKSDDLAGLRGTQDGRDAGALRAVS
jgi:hypothetical protein